MWKTRYSRCANSRLTARSPLWFSCLFLCCLACDSLRPTSPEDPSGRSEPPPVTPPVTQPASRLDGWITGISVNGQSGTWRNGTFPQESGGPSIRVIGNSSVVNGGTTELRVEGNRSLRFLLVGEQGGGRGYYEIPAGNSQRVTARLVFAQDLPSDLRLRVAAASDGGAAGPAERHDFDVVEVGTGELQVTLSWDVDSDVDLHVVEPNGEEIYYGNRTSESGGTLDLDSNPACSIDGLRNENVTWERSAPIGRYTVRVDYWSSCAKSSTELCSACYRRRGQQDLYGHPDGIW